MHVYIPPPVKAADDSSGQSEKAGARDAEQRQRRHDRDGLLRMPRSTARSSRGLILIVTAFALALPSSSAASPSTGVGSLETRAYMRDFDVSFARASQILETQAQANAVDIVGQLEARLGRAYAGVWFDNESGEFVVPLLQASDRERVESAFDVAGIPGHFHAVAAQSSWVELEQAQERLTSSISEMVEEQRLLRGHVLTSIDPRTNSVVVDRTGGVSQAVWQRLWEKAQSTHVRVVIDDDAQTEPVPAYCSALIKACDQPLRGGVSISTGCTAGFKATDSIGNRYVLTAGHCAEYVSQSIYASNSSWEEKKIGPVDILYNGMSGADVARIFATDPYWNIPSWPTQLVLWTKGYEPPTNSEYSITSESGSYLGDYVCHVGISTGTSCGYVRKVEVTLESKTFVWNHMTEAFGSTLCVSGGDSGGPVYAGHSAIGITSARDDEYPECGGVDYFSEITEDTELLGVSVAPRGGAPPIPTTTAATNVGWNQATGNGTVDPNGLPTTYYFQYGTTTSYGNATGSASAGSGWNATAVSASIGYLTPGTTYHYRLVATNSAGTSYGPDKVLYSSRAGVFFPDATNSNSMTRWEWNTSKGWQQEFLYGHAVAAGSTPATLMFNGAPHVFFVDAADNNTITDWTWSSSSGWQQVPLYGHQVAKGTSPVALLVNGTPHVFFVDASNSNTISDWTWSSSSGWQQVPLWGHQAAAGTSPAAMMFEGKPHVFFVDAADANTITDWTWNASSAWQQVPLWGHAVSAGSSPSAMVNNGYPEVFFSDASNSNTTTAWVWSAGAGWQQAFLYGHPLAKGSSPEAVMNNGIPEVFFSDASNSNTITAWVWSSQNGWQQAALYGHSVAAGTSPVPVIDNNIPNVYFVDASNNTIVDWTWNPTTGWQQSFFLGHPVAAGSSPGAF